MIKRTYPDNYSNKGEAMRLVHLINKYWSDKGYPGFRAHLEERVEQVGKNRKRVFDVRSNIRLRVKP